MHQAPTGDPIVQIIVVRYSTNFSILQVKECTSRQDVCLAIGFRQAFIGCEIFAVYDEFRRARLPSSLAMMTMSVRFSL